MSWTPATAQELRARVWKARGWYLALTLALGSSPKIRASMDDSMNAMSDQTYRADCTTGATPCLHGCHHGECMRDEAKVLIGTASIKQPTVGRAVRDEFEILSSITPKEPTQ